MSQANLIAQPSDGFAGTEKIPEFPGAIQRGRIEKNMVVDMRLIDMRCNDESMFAFGKPHGKLITNFVCFFRRHFTGLERLPDLIGQHVMLSDLPSCDGGVLTFCK
mgnify:CR=1 FL=1